MINTGSGGLEFLLILAVLGIMAAGYYFLVVVPSRRDAEDDWDDSEGWPPDE